MSERLRVCAVSYLNTAPLVWGFSHGPQRGLYDLRFALPAQCADELRAGSADIGLVPAIELARQPDLLVIPSGVIACRGPVRSVLLISRKPIETIESFAADTSSRTSVALTRVLLARRYGLRPRVRPYPPRIDDMLEVADAGLIIGDPALRLDPGQADWRGQPLFVYDLGAEWVEMTGLPMVFAVWAVKNLAANPALPLLFQASLDFGLSHLDDIVEQESVSRNLPPELVRDYLAHNTTFEFGEAEQRSLALFLRSAFELGVVDSSREVAYMGEPAVAETE